MPSCEEGLEESELESILGITVDMSGSYNERFETTAYPMLTQICDSYFKETMGSEGSKLVISQLSGKTDQIILFEGRPADLRKRFKSAQELAAHLREKADPSASRVSETMCRSLDYIGSVSGRTKKTKVMAIVFSDMCETENDPAKLGALEDALMVSLKKHQCL